MLNKPDIQDLLDRYWEGETTLEEERRLKDFFAAEPVPEQYRQEAELFRALRLEQAVQMPAGREARIAPRPSYRLGWWAAAASVALLLGAGIWWLNRHPLVDDVPVAEIVPQNNPVQQPAIVPPATLENEKNAPVAIAQAKTLKKRGVHGRTLPAGQQAPAVAQDTYEDPEQALEEIKAVLALVSNKINKSKKEIGKGLQEVEAVDILFKKKKETSG